MKSEPQNKNDLNKEWADFFALQIKRVSDPTGFSFEQYRDALIPIIKRILQYAGIDLESPTFNDNTDYQEIRNMQIQGCPGGFMSLDEFMNRFLLNADNGDYYTSLYDMGNRKGFLQEYDYSDDAVVDDITCSLQSLPEEVDNEDRRKRILDNFHSNNGLIERMKRYLNFDLDSYCKQDMRTRREYCKILHFFYLLEHEFYPGEKVLMLLDKPSMESIDNSFLGWETHNGKIISFVKESLGKELSVEEKDRVYSAIANVSFAWDSVLSNTQYLLDFLHDYEFDYNSVNLLQSPIPGFIYDKANQEGTYQYPIERLYLTICQREYLGNLLDIAFINKIQTSNNYDVPPELVEEMKSLRHTPVDFNNAEKHIKDNALRLSHYVYLGKETTKEDVRRIRTFAHKFEKYLNFCYRANPRIDIQEISNELQIVSFLQALILDNQNEVFDYIYHGYQYRSKHMMRVQAALKNDKRVPDALQVYWVRKVTDRWYANVGKYDVRLKLRQIEQICDEIRKQILSQPTFDEMIAAHKFYMEHIDPSLLDVKETTNAVCRIVEFLQEMGFKYEDRGCKIRYAFLDSENCDDICKKIKAQIYYAIHEHEPFYQVECEPQGSAVRDAGFLLNFAFDFDKRTCVLAQFEFVLG